MCAVVHTDRVALLVKFIQILLQMCYKYTIFDSFLDNPFTYRSGAVIKIIADILIAAFTFCERAVNVYSTVHISFSKILQLRCTLFSIVRILNFVKSNFLYYFTCNLRAIERETFPSKTFIHKRDFSQTVIFLITSQM